MVAAAHCDAALHGNAHIVSNVVAALEQLGLGRQIELRTDFVHCDAPSALVVVDSTPIIAPAAPRRER